MSDVEEISETIKLQPITPSNSFEHLLLVQALHEESDEEFYNSYAQTRPWYREELMVVAAALICLGEEYDKEFYDKFIHFFAEHIDEDKDDMTYERLEEQIQYLRSNLSLYYDLKIEAKSLLHKKLDLIFQKE
jgi:hypothetical protein